MAPVPGETDDHIKQEQVMKNTMRMTFKIGLLIFGFWVVVVVTAGLGYYAGRMSATAEVNLDPKINLKLDPSALELSTENKVLLDASTLKIPKSEIPDVYVLMPQGKEQQVKIIKVPSSQEVKFPDSMKVRLTNIEELKGVEKQDEPKKKEEPKTKDLGLDKDNKEDSWLPPPRGVVIKKD